MLEELFLNPSQMDPESHVIGQWSKSFYGIRLTFQWIGKTLPCVHSYKVTNLFEFEGKN